MITKVETLFFLAMLVLAARNKQEKPSLDNLSEGFCIFGNCLLAAA